MLLFAALAMKNVPYEYKAVGDEPFKGQDDLVARNPMRMVPFMMFEDDEGTQAISQSMAILDYLEQAVPSPPLWPKKFIDRANAIIVAEIVNSFIQPLQHDNLMETLTKLGADADEFAKNIATRGFKALEIIVSKTCGKYCIGDEVTIADLYLAPQMRNANLQELDLSEFPTLNRINASLMELDSFKLTHPDYQPHPN